jgi:hypothetical protein
MSGGRTGNGRRPDRLQVGAHVRVQFPGGSMVAEVVDDFGFIGIRDRQIVHVRALEQTDLPQDFDIPAEEVEVLWVPPPRRGQAA